MRVWLTIQVFLLIGLAAAAPAQEPRASVSVQVEPQSVKLAESFTLTVRAAAPEGQTWQLPDVLELSPFVEKSRAQKQETVDGKPVQVFRLTLVTYDEVGELTIPGFVLRSSPTDGGTAVDLQVPESKISVVSMLAGVEKPEPRDVAEPVEITIADYRLLVYLGFLLLWALMTLSLRFWLARTRTEKRLEVLPPVQLAHEIALKKLHQVVEDDLLRQDRAQEYFVRISEAVREYLGNRYGFFALDLTSRELLEELRDRPTPGLEHGSLSRLLDDADLVKFAKLHPSDEMSSSSIDGAFEVVHKTKLVEEQVSE